LRYEVELLRVSGDGDPATYASPFPEGPPPADDAARVESRRLRRTDLHGIVASIDNERDRSEESVGKERPMRGEKIYEYDLDVTGVTDHGMTLESILSGQAEVPPQGVRVDVAFEGRAVGRLAGRVRGVDYARLRADGRIDLDIRATFETDSGQRVALSASGVATPRADEPIADLWENVTLGTAATEYAWVNTRQVWGIGTVDFAAGKIHVDAYMK
jgi:hypothetical protein